MSASATPAASMLQWLGRAGKARLLRSLQKSSDFEAFIKDASPGIVELDELMPLIDVLGIKRGQLYSDALQHMVSMLKDTADMMSASDASCLLDVTMELIEEIPELGALAAKLLYTVKGWPDYYLGKLVALTNIHKELPDSVRLRMWLQHPVSFFSTLKKWSRQYLASFRHLRKCFSVLPSKTFGDTLHALQMQVPKEMLGALLREPRLWRVTSSMLLSAAQSTGSPLYTMLRNDVHRALVAVASERLAVPSALLGSRSGHSFMARSASVAASKALRQDSLATFRDALEALMRNPSAAGIAQPLDRITTALLTLKQAAIEAPLQAARSRKAARTTEDGQRGRKIRSKSKGAAGGAAGGAGGGRKRGRNAAAAPEDDLGSDEEEEEEGSKAFSVMDFLPEGTGDISLRDACSAAIEAAWSTDAKFAFGAAGVGLFGKPVLEVYPQLEEDYRSVIKQPICLQDMRSKLIAGQYHDLSQAFDDANLMHQNARTYNASDEKVLMIADAVRQAFVDVAKAAAARLHPRLRGWRFVIPPDHEPPERQKAAAVHLGGCLGRQDDFFGVGPAAAKRTRKEQAAASARATYTTPDRPVSRRRVLLLAHTAAWAADCEPNTVSIPEGGEWFTTLQRVGYWRTPLQDAYPQGEQQLNDAVAAPVDLGTMQKRIQADRYASVEEAEAEFDVMEQQMRVLFKPGSNIFQSHAAALQAARAAWTAEVQRWTSQLAPEAPDSVVQAAVDATEPEPEPAPRPPPPKMPSAEPSQRPPTAGAAEAAAGQGGAQPPQQAGSARPAAPPAAPAPPPAPVPPGEELPAATQPMEPAVQVASRTAAFADLKAALLSLGDARCQRSFAVAMFSHLQLCVRKGQVPRTNAELGRLLSLVCKEPAEFGPLMMSLPPPSLPDLPSGQTAASEGRLHALLTPRDWLGLTLLAESLKQVSDGMRSLQDTAKDDPLHDLLPAIELDSRGIAPLPLAWTALHAPEYTPDVFAAAAVSGRLPWMLALFLGVKLQAGVKVPCVALPLLRCVTSAVTTPGSHLATPGNLAMLVCSVADTVQQLYCPAAANHAAAQAGLPKENLTSDFVPKELMQPLVFLLGKWAPALAVWVLKQAAAAPKAAARAHQQGSYRAHVPEARQGPAPHWVSASREAWMEAAFPLCLSCMLAMLNTARQHQLLRPHHVTNTTHSLMQLLCLAAPLLATTDSPAQLQALLSEPAADGPLLLPGVPACAREALLAHQVTPFEKDLRELLHDEDINVDEAAYGLGVSALDEEPAAGSTGAAQLSPAELARKAFAEISQPFKAPGQQTEAPGTGDDSASGSSSGEDDESVSGSDSAGEGEDDGAAPPAASTAPAADGEEDSMEEGEVEEHGSVPGPAAEIESEEEGEVVQAPTKRPRIDGGE